LVLLGLELGFPALLPEHVEGLTLSDREKFGSGAGRRLLGFGDLGGLVQGYVPVTQGIAEVVRVPQDTAGNDCFFRPAHRCACHPSELGHVIQLAGKSCDSESCESLGAHVGLQSLPGRGNAQQLWLQIGVGFLEQLDGFVDGGDFHACQYGDGL
jgi:hypothetical protein